MRGSVTDFFASSPPYVGAGEAGGSHLLKSLFDLFVFNNSFCLKHQGDFRSTGKSWGKAISFIGNYFKKFELMVNNFFFVGSN